MKEEESTITANKRKIQKLLTRINSIEQQMLRQSLAGEHLCKKEKQMLCQSFLVAHDEEHLCKKEKRGDNRIPNRKCFKSLKNNGDKLDWIVNTVCKAGEPCTYVNSDRIFLIRITKIYEFFRDHCNCSNEVFLARNQRIKYSTFKCNCHVNK